MAARLCEVFMVVIRERLYSFYCDFPNSRYFFDVVACRIDIFRFLVDLPKENLCQYEVERLVFNNWIVFRRIVF